MKLPKLPPQPIRNEDKRGYEKEIWQPHWKCFCCQDTGEVKSHLVLLVIPEYNDKRDRTPICQNPGCSAGTNWLHLGPNNIDMRLTSTICQELDRINREDWEKTIENKITIVRQKIADLAQQKSLRQNARSSTEEMIAQQKHTAVLDGWGIEAQNDSEQEWLGSRTKDDEC